MAKTILLATAIVLVYFALAFAHFVVEDYGRLKFNAPARPVATSVPRTREGLAQLRVQQAAEARLDSWAPYVADRVFWIGSALLACVGTFIYGLYESLVRARRRPLRDRIGALIAIYVTWFPGAFVLAGAFILPLAMSHWFFLSHTPGSICALIGLR